MNATIRPGTLSGAVRVPASKSAAHRALICAALADGHAALRIGALNDDIRATIRCLAALGARIETDGRGGRLAVSPVGAIPADARAACLLDCGESGSTLRFLLPVACALDARVRFVGHGRLPERPNAALVEVLRAHRASIDSDHLPMNVSGVLNGGVYALPGNVSSQYITGLLLALPLLSEDSEIVLTTPLESASYVDMTLDMQRRFGIVVEATGTGWRVRGNQAYCCLERDIAIEGDWSAAAFWLAANAMGGDIAVSGLSEDTPQGDSAVARLLGQPLIDASNVPDLVPALSAAAAVLPQRTVITGAARLRLKESDRLQAVANMINALGGRAAVTADGLIIDGGVTLRGGTVDGRNDHRIVMAAAILATCASGPVTITGADAVAKSYPAFFEDFTALGGKCNVEPAGH